MLLSKIGCSCTTPRKGWADLFPDYKSYARSFYALHEMLGLAYYRYHYGKASGR